MPFMILMISITCRIWQNIISQGLCVIAAEITAITNQWVNSYKRLVPGYEAPVYVSWARRNRSAMIRVPCISREKKAATRIEFRSPDPSCNPYLAFAMMLGAGLEGIENKYELPDPIEEDIFEMNPSQGMSMVSLAFPAIFMPQYWRPKKAPLLKRFWANMSLNKFIENKKIEWDQYRTHVSRFELDRYLPKL